MCNCKPCTSELLFIYFIIVPCRNLHFRYIHTSCLFWWLVTWTNVIGTIVIFTSAHIDMFCFLVFLKIIMFYYLHLNFVCHNFMQINCNPNYLLYAVFSPCNVIFFLIYILKHTCYKHKRLSKYSIAQTTVGRIF